MQLNSNLVTSLAFKTAGIVLIASTLVNIIFAALPYQPGDVKWWAQLGIELLGRGFFSLVGVVFLMAGKWLENINKESGRGDHQNWFFLSALISVIFGLIYLAIIPFQIIAANQDRDKAFTNMNQELGRTEAAIKERLSVFEDKAKVQQQIAALDQQIKSGQVQGPELETFKQEKALYEKLSADPNELKRKSTELLGQINQKRQSVTNQITIDLFRTGIRASLFSLLLATGHIFIGFAGLRHRR